MEQIKDNNKNIKKSKAKREIFTAAQNDAVIIPEISTEKIKFIEHELEDKIGLEDYEIDRINIESEYLKEKPLILKEQLEKAKKIMNKLLLIFTIVFCLIFAIPGFIYSPFIFGSAMIALIVVIWLIYLSPLEHHQFPHDFYYIKYRGYLEQGFKFIKAHLKDEMHQYLFVLYLTFNLMLIFSVIDPAFFNPWILDRLNEIIYDRGNYPNSLINSVIPPIVILGIFINLIGAFIISNYKVRDPLTGKYRTSKDIEKTKRNGKLIVLISIMFFVAVSIAFANDLKVFLTPSSGANWISIFDPDDAKFHGRSVAILYYIIIIGGSTLLTFLIYIGISSGELGLIHIIIRKNRESMPIEEKVWEPDFVTERKEKEIVLKNKARKAALFEIIGTNAGIVIGLWPCLWLGSDEMLDTPFLEYLGYGILGLGVLWIFFFSPIYHIKKDGPYWYKTINERNWNYAFWDERGLGSAKYYFIKVFGKKKRLLFWVSYWFLMSMSMVFFDWKSIWNGNPPSGIIPDIANSISLDKNYMTVATIFVILIFTIIGLFIAVNQTEKNFRGSIFWCNLYKLVMAFMLFCCFGWITTVVDIINSINIFSVEFISAFSISIAFYALLGFLASIIAYPFLFKFDNFHVSATAILLILVNTIILMGLLAWIFHVFLPMTGPSGEIAWPYPFDTGAENEVDALLDKFWLGPFFAEWGGRYVWWGALQQYLFMSYYLTLWKKVFPNSKGYLISVGTSMIFGVIHAIDWPLMLFTGIAGLMWSFFWNYEYFDKKERKVHRGNNLLLWGFVHGFGGTLVGMIIPITMGVGPFNM
ncbi:MAG: hypothetical protein ACTSRZ_04935 [Promethearchaeota archaeon]